MIDIIFLVGMVGAGIFATMIETFNLPREPVAVIMLSFYAALFFITFLSPKGRRDGK